MVTFTAAAELLTENFQKFPNACYDQSQVLETGMGQKQTAEIQMLLFEIVLDLEEKK